jgi:hypothetical protein
MGVMSEIVVGLWSWLQGGGVDWFGLMRFNGCAVVMRKGGKRNDE